MIEIGKENEKIKNKGKWYYCHHMRIFPFWGDNHRLPLLHMDKQFIWIEETKERINQFGIGYMNNPNLYTNKDFVYQVETCMNTIFGALTQPFIKTTSSKNNTSFQNY